MKKINLSVITGLALILSSHGYANQEPACAQAMLAQKAEYCDTLRKTLASFDGKKVSLTVFEEVGEASETAITEVGVSQDENDKNKFMLELFMNEMIDGKNTRVSQQKDYLYLKKDIVNNQCTVLAGEMIDDPAMPYYVYHVEAQEDELSKFSMFMENHSPRQSSLMCMTYSRVVENN